MSAKEILRSAIEMIDERAKERDIEEERSMGATVAAFNALRGYDLTETDGWLFMVCLKIARMRPNVYTKDNYIDAAAYAALAGERG